MFIKEFFLGTSSERDIIKRTDALRAELNPTTKEARRLADLELLVTPISRRLALRRVGAGVVGIGMVGVPLAASLLLRQPGTKESVLASKEEETPDLKLSIDEAGFWRAVAAGPKMVLMPHVNGNNKGNHFGSLGNIWVSETSSEFKGYINQPMAEFMFKQADFANPILPARLQLWGDWLEGDPGEHLGGLTSFSMDGTEQAVIISLKAAALLAFKTLETKGISLPDIEIFNGAISYFASRWGVHELAHAGREMKKKKSIGLSLMEQEVSDRMHPQIFAFEDKYAQLYDQAAAKGLGPQALLFGVDTAGIDLRTYKQQIYQEASFRGF